MKAVINLRRVVAIVGSVTLVSSGCAFSGLNSIPLPGAVGRGADAVHYVVEIANVGTLEANSPVMIDNVIVGSVSSLRFDDWHADVEVSIRPDVAVPANATATVGQTSLLGSMHVALDPPVGQRVSGRLLPGSTIPLDNSSSYPSTERTLAALSTVVNSGGLGQFGDIIHGFNTALNGREPQVRGLLDRLNQLMGIFDDQRDGVVATLDALDRLAATVSDQHTMLTAALNEIPPALDVLIAERPKFTAALEKLRVLSDTSTKLVDDTGADLVATLQNLDPTLRALADVGPEIDTALAYLPVMPFGQNVIDRAIRGDYMNLFAVFDLTNSRLKRTLLAGTRWGDSSLHLVPAPGDPGYDAFYGNPLAAPLAPMPPAPSTTETPNVQPEPTPPAPKGPR